MKTQQIENLFDHYLAAFSAYDLDAVVACYHIPCTLHTPDKIVLVNSIDDCRQEFNDIFTQLKQANTAKIVARSASYMSINDDLLLACVDWGFIDEQGQVFADFCAYYHISILNSTKQKLAIVNVVSHELVNSLSLANTFSISG
ncbi:hypothetical protein [Candidatus Colwellia aromaticivorans]|uniref:hypothetical protein n=1 Tax=Candidatus Colwellia aromaticivorans TaxID=2267621 RepID=UPI000DF3FF41|nr:hypothetical protein [Candidatus Colwellia aromaticivorans]